jgi:hypothetical protein
MGNLYVAGVKFISKLCYQLVPVAVWSKARRSWAAMTLGSWVRIQLVAWVYRVRQKHLTVFEMK